LTQLIRQRSVSSPVDHELKSVLQTFKEKLNLYMAYTIRSDDFQLVKEGKNHAVYTRKDPLYLTKRCLATLDHPIDDIINVLMDPSNAAWHTSDLKKAELVKRLSPTTSIIYVATKSPMFVADRDFYAYSHFYRVSEDHFILMNFSAPAELYPSAPKHVRVDLDCIVWSLKRLPGGRSEIDFLMRANPNISGLSLSANQLPGRQDRHQRRIGPCTPRSSHEQTKVRPFDPVLPPDYLRCSRFSL
jgi:hypothetical protein